MSPGDNSRRVATVVAEPLERGVGQTLGNSLRRVLLSSLQGAAITSIHIDGVLHEFSSIPGVGVDVVDIVLNVKDIAVKMQGEGVKRLVLKRRGPGPVTAGDALNKQQHPDPQPGSRHLQSRQGRRTFASSSR